jgi:putative transposase
VARRPRVALGGLIYHVLNRGVRRQALFLNSGDYKLFLRLLVGASHRFPVPLLAYCLMPNHWHFIVRPTQDKAISAYVQWLTSAHARYINASRAFTGHVYESRFKSVVVRDDRQLITLLQYVESNPVRAHLVSRAEAWRWSSLTARPGIQLAPSPYRRPENWLDLLAMGSDAVKEITMT